VASEGDRQSGESANQEDEAQRGSKWVLLLLILPYLGLLYPPIYARVDPTLWGLPFFIWYQFLWVFITVGITALVYRVRG
jgi:Protein of unknown function (DUF3311)